MGAYVLAEAGTSLSTVLKDIGSVFNAIVGFANSFLNQIVSNPLTLTIIGVSLIAVGLGFVFKLLRGV